MASVLSVRNKTFSPDSIVSLSDAIVSDADSIVSVVQLKASATVGFVVAAPALGAVLSMAVFVDVLAPAMWAQYVCSVSHFFF